MSAKEARAELLAAVEDFDVNARTANVRLANAIEDMIKAMLSEQSADRQWLSGTVAVDNEGVTTFTRET